MKARLAAVGGGVYHASRSRAAADAEEQSYESDEKALRVLGNCCELKSESSLTRLLMSALT